MGSLSTVKGNDNSFQSMSNATENAINVDDIEISIFDAEKYFSEELNDMKKQVTAQQSEKKPSHDHLLPPVQELEPPSLSSPAEFRRSKSATPSEASWNSQTALLAAAAHHRTGKRWSAAKKWFLRRNCCCSNGESVRVKDVISDHTRPIVLIDTVKTGNRNSKTLHADGDRRDVVEIHQIRAAESPRQQRISATGRPFINAAVGFTFPTLNSSAAAAAAAAREDDVGSDASSDLFEIETFSTQTASSRQIHCMCDPVDGDSNGERKLTPANGLNSAHRRRLSVPANECRPATTATADCCDGELEEIMAALRPPREEAGGGEGRRKSDGGAMPVSCRPAMAKCAAEGPTLVPFRVGGRPLPAEKPRQGSSPSPPLVAAGG